MPTGGYGTHWNTYGHMGGTFEDYAVNGETALVCPECGCQDGKSVTSMLVGLL